MELTVDQMRQMSRERAAKASDAGVELVEIAGVPAEWVTADGASAEGPTVLYLHSGAYLTGSPAASRSVSWALSEAVGGRVIAPDYRLAPDHPFPAMFDDCLAVYRSLVTEGAIEPGRLAVAGDAAGASLTVAVLADARDEGLPLACCAVANSPYCDMAAASASLNDPSHYPGGAVDREVYDWLMATFLGGGGTEPRDPRHSPVYRDLSGLPPLLVQEGGLDPFYDDGIRLADNARSAGVSTTLTLYPSSPHIWIGNGAADEESKRAFDEIGEFVRFCVSAG
jgi:acetyl esterase/lipase